MVSAPRLLCCQQLLKILRLWPISLDLEQDFELTGWSGEPLETEEAPCDWREQSLSLEKGHL